MTNLALGWFGIVLVLLSATRHLEVKQEESYGKDTKYQDWIESTWSGWMLPRPATKQEFEKDSSDMQQELSTTVSLLLGDVAGAIGPKGVDFWSQDLVQQ